MKPHKYLFLLVLWICVIAYAIVPYQSSAWISGGVVIGGPVYYPAPYAYPPEPYPYAYPPPPPATYPQQTMAPPPAETVYGRGPSPMDDCREYTHSVVIAGERQSVHGHACRQSDGTWHIID